jgi:hypothetical protein
MNAHAFVSRLLEDDGQPIQAEPPAKPNPLDGKSKQSAQRIVYNTVDHLTKGFFRDEYWKGPAAIFKAASDAGFSMNVMNTAYQNDSEGTPNQKYWVIEIPFVNNKGKPDKLQGRLVASGAGSVKDPLAIYDLSLMVS